MKYTNAIANGLRRIKPKDDFKIKMEKLKHLNRLEYLPLILEELDRTQNHVHYEFLLHLIYEMEIPNKSMIVTQLLQKHIDHPVKVMKICFILFRYIDPSMCGPLKKVLLKYESSAVVAGSIIHAMIEMRCKGCKTLMKQYKAKYEKAEPFIGSAAAFYLEEYQKWKK